jgi:tyrosyl-tRNA synthetase
MASRAIVSKLAPSRTTIYSRCLNAQRSLQVRNVATTYLKKVAEGEERWKERAEKIENGEIPHTWDVLQERGYIKDVAGHATLPMILDSTIYLTYTLDPPTRSRRLCESGE